MTVSLGSSGCGKACGGKPGLPTLRTAARKKGSVALPHRRWVKENSAAGSGLPPSLKAIELTLHLLPFPVRRDTDASFTSCEGGERDKGGNAVLFRSGEERVRDYEYRKH